MLCIHDSYGEEYMAALLGGGYTPSFRMKEPRELIQCPVSSCDGSGHISGLYATHRRQDSMTPTNPEHAACREPAGGCPARRRSQS